MCEFKGFRDTKRSMGSMMNYHPGPSVLFFFFNQHFYISFSFEVLFHIVVYLNSWCIFSLSKPCRKKFTKFKLTGVFLPNGILGTR